MKDTENFPDLKTVKKAVRGNADAYGVLINIHKEYLYRTAYLYAGNEQAALEVVQETVLRGFKGIRRLKDPALFKTWITRILINVSRDLYRKELRQAGIRTGMEEGAYSEKREQAPRVSAEERIDLYRAVSALPDNYRTVIILRYFDELKEEEIAEIMEVPRGTVSVWLTRARRELKEYLKEGYLDE